MRSGFWIFFKKEWMELWRIGKLIILLAVFVLFGIMNPAVAKLTPWLMEQMAEELAENGLFVSEVTVDASASFAQFFKNIPMVLILFILLFGGSLTNEWERGRLIPLLTRGLSRLTVVAAKAAVIVLLWSVGYWLCFGITLGYNLYFWGGEKTAHYLLAAALPYLFGLWIIIMLLVVSAAAKSATAVLAELAAIVIVCCLAGILPGAGQWLPTRLISVQALAAGQEKITEFIRAVAVTGFSGMAGYLGAVFGFKRKLI